MYKIIFNCDLVGDHRASTLNLCCVDSIDFADLLDALKFLDECTQAITKRSELHQVYRIIYIKMMKYSLI